MYSWISSYFGSKATQAGETVVNKIDTNIEKNPEVESFTKTVVNKAVRYGLVTEKLLHFHLVVFGFMLGLGLLTGTIAMGKFAVAVEIELFKNNKELIFNIGYFSLFFGIIFGFIKHYMSDHHARRLEKNQHRLERQYAQKDLELENNYRIKHQERLDELNSLVKMIEKRKQELADEEAKLEKLNATDVGWMETINSYNPFASSDGAKENG